MDESPQAMDESPQGWYTDPYERHEARWMSEGKPTALVRDGDIEGNDPPPDEPFKVEPVRIEGEGRPPGDGSEPVDAAWETFGENMA